MSFCGSTSCSACVPARKRTSNFVLALEQLRKDRAAKHKQLLVELETAKVTGDEQKHQDIRQQINKLFYGS